MSFFLPKSTGLLVTKLNMLSNNLISFYSNFRQIYSPTIIKIEHIKIFMTNQLKGNRLNLLRNKHYKKCIQYIVIEKSKTLFALYKNQIIVNTFSTICKRPNIKIGMFIKFDIIFTYPYTVFV